MLTPAGGEHRAACWNPRNSVAGTAPALEAEIAPIEAPSRRRRVVDGAALVEARDVTMHFPVSRRRSSAATAKSSTPLTA